MKRKVFTKEFKLEAVHLLEGSGRQAAEVARELGVRRNQLYKWQYEVRGKAERAFPGRGQHPELADELTRLRRENARLQEERDILKKAMNRGGVDIRTRPSRLTRVGACKASLASNPKIARNAV